MRDLVLDVLDGVAHADAHRPTLAQKAVICQYKYNATPRIAAPDARDERFVEVVRQPFSSRRFVVLEHHLERRQHSHTPRIAAADHACTVFPAKKHCVNGMNGTFRVFEPEPHNGRVDCVLFAQSAQKSTTSEIAPSSYQTRAPL